jgi:hypothetical protein
MTAALAGEAKNMVEAIKPVTIANVAENRRKERRDGRWSRRIGSGHRGEVGFMVTPSSRCSYRPKLGDSP